MKKIGILTYHRIVNWGSVLQAYSLQKFLQRMYPLARVEIIDYYTKTAANYISNQTTKYNLGKLPLISKKRSAFNPSYLNKQKALNHFLNQKCQLSPKQFVSDSLEESKSFLEEQKYDLVMVGSDQVFQMGPNFRDVYLCAPPPPNLYFLPFKASFRKIAFAASANPFQPKLLKQLDQTKLSQALNDFETIFYRDEPTRVAMELLGVKAEKLGFMPDPSLLVDFDLLCDNSEKNYQCDNLAAVAVGNRNLSNRLCDILIKAGYQPISLLSNPQSKKVMRLEEVNSLEQFIAIHRQFKLVITDRFHGSIITFAVGDCPIIGIEEQTKYPEKNSKLRDLYKRLGVEFMVHYNTGDTLDKAWLEDYLSRWKFRKAEIIEKILQLRIDAVNKFHLL